MNERNRRNRIDSPSKRNEIHSFELGFLQLHEKVKNHFIESTIQRKDWSISMIPSFFSPFPDGQCRLDSEKTISRPSVFLQIFKDSNRAANLRQKRPSIEHIVRNLRQTVISPRLLVPFSLSFSLFPPPLDLFLRPRILLREEQYVITVKRFEGNDCSDNRAI